ncbi:hypothetical protein GWR56_15435 [Mucilaginibacter sp. 14171R-50]|uniref:hypothetical protein n=1 Tax=Mucilaginibacter sp. 14171R-50 TaxID=2703789 RepID=UPI00138BBD78|nr:hypothetical protein [Mucilaginibacter sp. 14171R-50]QHS56869.1 hypothetical protein GWR56_15435 [Mucilaginibacter sp. 14171R-50]
MVPEENAAPGQQNFPDENGDTQRETQSGQEIIKGARQEDQLDAMKEEAKNNPSENSQGASPDDAEGEDKNRLSQNDINNNINTFEQTQAARSALETPEGKNNGAKPAAFDGQQSSHP